MTFEDSRFVLARKCHISEHCSCWEDGVNVSPFKRLTRSKIVILASEPSHTRGAPDVPEPLRGGVNVSTFKRLNTPNNIVTQASEPSHSRGAPEVPKPLTLAQYLNRYSTWKQFRSARKSKWQTSVPANDLLTRNKIVTLASKPSHSRGAPEVPEPLTLAQYLNKYDT